MSTTYELYDEARVMSAKACATLGVAIDQVLRHQRGPAQRVEPQGPVGVTPYRDIPLCEFRMIHFGYPTEAFADYVLTFACYKCARQLDLSGNEISTLMPSTPPDPTTLAGRMYMMDTAIEWIARLSRGLRCEGGAL